MDVLGALSVSDKFSFTFLVPFKKKARIKIEVLPHSKYFEWGEDGLNE